MAKQRRASARPARKPGKNSVAPTSPRSSPARSAPAERHLHKVESQKSPPRAAYLEAVAHYERGILALQAHDYGQATDILQSILVSYPDEKELHERIRLYLNICERQQAAHRPVPQTLEELILAATLAINAGRFDEADRHLQRTRDHEPEHEQVFYLRAVVETHRGHLEDAAQLLQRAVELNPDNRSIARNDPDLDDLRSHHVIRSLLEPPARAERRRAGKLRGAR